MIISRTSFVFCSIENIIELLRIYDMLKKFIAIKVSHSLVVMRVYSHLLLVIRIGLLH